MKKACRFCIVILLFLSVSSFHPKGAPAFWSYTADTKKVTVRTYYKDRKGERIDNLHALKSHIEGGGKKMLFAMNCGMYSTTYTPVGLYIEGGKPYSGIRRCNTAKANFCLQPQGVFYVRTDGRAGISTVQSFSAKGVRYATQSAPVVVQNGKMNPKLPRGLQLVRNGVGIRKDGKVVLAISREGVNFHEFAQFFIGQGCTTAMYFDGNISQAYYPGRVTPYNASFGAMVAVVQ
ncbi:MAG TPA: phosphodiester glycosidase family protein [Chitinophagaceae bacterium]